MAKRYRRAIFSREPVINRRPVKRHRTPVKRHSIFNRVPLTSVKTEYQGCQLYGCNCENCVSEQEFCEWDADVEKYDFHTFRLIRISEILDEDAESELIKKIHYVKSLGCYIRLITDVELPNGVLFALGYNPLNVVQFNINIMETSEEVLRSMKTSIFTADNCGLYVALMLYPIIPEVTHTSGILELLNSFRCSCNNICFKYLDLPCSTPCSNGYYNVNGHLVPECYYQRIGDKLGVTAYFRRTFSTIMTKFLTVRKVNCSCCNDHICY